MSDDATYRVDPVGFVSGPMEDRSGFRLADRLGVFRRPANANDSLPAETSRKIATFVRLSGRHRPGLGELQPGASRRAIDPTGARSTPFYVVPTDTGAVCYAIGTSVDCIVSLLRDKIGWNLTYWSNEDGTIDLIVHGLVSDDVTGVHVLFNSGGSRTAVAATVEGNAFLARVNKTRIKPSSIGAFDLQLKDGSSREVSAG